IEHGGPRIVVSVGESGGCLRVSVRDCGRPLPLPGTVRAGRRVGLRDRLRGRPRHGHGLRVVRRVAAQHGGRFALRRSAGGAEAVLELPAA
ncbi:MAG: Histidine kinase, gyrase and HSP90-like ATPase, partial [Solirubrobacterales bacterium]|nr:Histidine kinase, gyrase and HSP90-like ATPase [Solirubrobacterales bacterium]